MIDAIGGQHTCWRRVGGRLRDARGLIGIGVVKIGESNGSSGGGGVRRIVVVVVVGIR